MLPGEQQTPHVPPETQQGTMSFSPDDSQAYEEMVTARGRKRKLNPAEVFSLGPKKRPYVALAADSQVFLICLVRTRTDPLVHHGRHFGRTVRAFCRIQALIRQGLAITVQLELEDIAEDALTDEFVPL
jgi:hypothetical protein